jgi:penicillin amidase
LTAISKWGSANQNGIFADVSGNIAYHTTGVLHARKAGDTGLFPLPGDGSMDFFDMEIAFDKLPQLLNPERGYIFSANNRILPEANPDNYTEFPQFDGLISGFRAERIGELIQGEIDAQRPITTEFMAQIQGDRTTLFKDWLKPTFQLLEQSSLSAEQVARFNALQTWSGEIDLATTAAPLFHEFYHCLKNVSYYELKGVSVFWLDIVYVQNVLTSNSCGDDWDMNCPQYVTQCFINACNTIPASQTEGSVHSAVFAHVTPVPPAAASLFDRERPYGGSPDTPFAADDGGSNTARAGPSYRQIISMGNRSDDKWIMPMGNSGNPRSILYDNLLNSWLNVEYLYINL